MNRSMWLTIYRKRIGRVQEGQLEEINRAKRSEVETLHSTYFVYRLKHNRLKDYLKLA
jgi:hypothetical protein